MVRAFVEAVALMIGLSGFGITFVQLYQLWRDGPGEVLSLAARRRQRALRAKAMKEKYGSILTVTAAAASFIVATLLCLLPLLGLGVLGYNLLGELAAFGILLWVRYAASLFCKRYF